MDLNTLNLIIGGSIALVASASTSFLNFLFQNHDSNKKRNWELEDKKREKSQKILLERIDQTEILVTGIIKWVIEQMQEIENFLDEDKSFTEFIKNSKPVFDNLYLSAV